MIRDDDAEKRFHTDGALVILEKRRQVNQEVHMHAIKRNPPLVYIFIASIILSGCANIGILTLLLHTPPQMITTGISTYWQDYFFYLSHFTQGAQGAWMTHNLYTSEITTPTLLYWCNILFGKLGGLVHLSPLFTFHLTSFLLNIILLLLLYIVFRRVFPNILPPAIPWVYAVCSTSLMNHIRGPVSWWPFQLWRTPHFLFDRLSTVPNHLMQTVLFFLLILLLFSPTKTHEKLRIGGITLAIIGLTLLHPITGAVVVASYGVSTWLNKKTRNIHRTIALIGGYVGAFLYTAAALRGAPFNQSQAWEATQQTSTTLLFLLGSIGPIVPFAGIGIISRRKTLVPVERAGVMTMIACYTLFLLPNLAKRIGISNARVLFPGMMLFFGWFGAVGADALATALARLPRLQGKKQTIRAVMVILFLLLVSPTIIFELRQNIPDPSAYAYSYYYLPRDTYRALTWIATKRPTTDVVLASPITQLDIRVPPFTGHQTVTGHPLTTIHEEQKTAAATRFFQLAMTKDEARAWLSQERVTYVLVTNQDKDVVSMQSAYPFLHLVYQTPTAGIFTIVPK